LLALEALPDLAGVRTRPYVSEAEFQLDAAWRELRERIVLVGHDSPVIGATYSPDGKRIVTTGSVALLWDATTGKSIGEPLKGHKGIIHSAAFSPDGKRIVTASNGTTARIWDAETYLPIGQPLTGHTSFLTGAAFTPDGKRIVTVSGRDTKGNAGLWDAETQSRSGLLT
jgi:WD40 repeat protein